MTHRATAFSLRSWVRIFIAHHERLIDDLTAAGVALLAIAGYYAAFALFAN